MSVIHKEPGKILNYWVTELSSILDNRITGLLKNTCALQVAGINYKLLGGMGLC